MFRNPNRRNIVLRITQGKWMLFDIGLATVDFHRASCLTANKIENSSNDWNQKTFNALNNNHYYYWWLRTTNDSDFDFLFNFCYLHVHYTYSIAWPMPASEFLKMATKKSNLKSLVIKPIVGFWWNESRALGGF